MPCLETSPTDQRIQFVVDYQRGLESMTELAAPDTPSTNEGLRII